MEIINSTPLRLNASAIAIVSSTSTAYAFEIEAGRSDLSASFDNTVKYGTAFCTKSISSGLTKGQSAANFHDADNNSHKGLPSNHLDLLSEFGLPHSNLGVRVSALTWYDNVYHNTDNAITDDQPPVDVMKLPSVPNFQFKDVNRTTRNVLADLSISESVSIGAYIGYEWGKSHFLPAGSYLV